MRYLSVMFAILLCAQAQEFNRDVRPILSDKCYFCHGPDAVAKKVPVRLDSEAAARRVLGNGDPASSLLVQRITAPNPAMRMPPPYSGLKLTDREIDTLRAWVAKGAKWEKHWSLIPPRRPTVPEGRNAIDYLVEQRLQREGLKPSPEAGRETLLRRVSLDLTGLPPAASEIDAFVADRSPDAYEKVVDRLLASPRYGERMAARWLDAARYADSNGYQYDGERYMWRWRDWVIDSFNRNQPYDRFVLEQIAGDMLPGATTAQKIATGFNRNHRANTEDGIIAEEYAVEYVVDRVETTSTVFLGLTLGCARCHNHKYDPFTQKEFYQVFAYFNNVPELGRAMKYGNSPPLVPAPTAVQQRALAGLQAKIDAAGKNLHRMEGAIAQSQRAWEKQIVAATPHYWSPAGAIEAMSSWPAGGEVPLVAGRVGRAASFNGKTWLSGGDIANFDIDDRYTISAWVYADGAPDGPVVTRMVDNPTGKGYGLHLNQGRVHVQLTSTYVSDAIRVESEETLEPRRWYHLLVTYSGSRMAEGLHVYIDGREAKLKVHQDNLYRPFRNAGKQFREMLRVAGGWGKERRFRGLIDDVRLYPRILHDDEIAALATGESVNAIAAKSPVQRSEAETHLLRWYFLEHEAGAEAREAWQRLIALRLEKENLERTFPTVMVMAESPVPKQTHLLVRGAYDKPAELISPGLPAVLPPLPAGAPNNRLGFAQWLIDPGNPLTARVAVNRFWQMYFGAGIVRTVEDFGVQGEWPSHPELLDWLATEFIRSGWNTKALQKTIVMSATYRQSSKATPELLQKDPENRLLARGPRVRLPAEMIRDQALFAAGLLTEKLGGPSVKPYQPEGLWKELAMQDMDYVQSKGPDLYRRSLYTFWKRTIAPPMMMNFDSAARESCVVRETRTDTPLQALNLMNDVTFVEAARFIGQRMLEEGGPDPDARLRYGFRLVTGHAPSPAERQVARDSLQFHLDYFAGKDTQIKKLLSQGDSPADPKLDGRELAAYASVASLLLNLDETVTKQ